MNTNSYNKILLILFLTLSLFAAKADDHKDAGTHQYEFYIGTFDTIDKEGDEKATMYGFEHKNLTLFRDTFIGKFSPVSGGFITDRNSIYLYTGVQAQYAIGPLKILPSFAPGYYNAGNGKNLGLALEFKSEIKLAFDILESSQIGFAYSHISNNDWGKDGKNPGVNNKTISFSKTF
jgi:lipid A 3-O-deacylase